MVILKFFIWISLFLIIASSPTPESKAGQWRNPKEVIKDPMIARLPQGRNKLTLEEKEEIRRYNHTGLEVMTYLDANTEPGKDNDAFYRVVQIDKFGHIRIEQLLRRMVYLYKDYRALLTYNVIKPGEIENKRIAIYLSPPDKRGWGLVSNFYLSNEKFPKQEEAWVWLPKLRRIRRFPTMDKSDDWMGSDMTMDDFYYRQPWEENHRILGEDNITGFDCFVVESTSRDPTYYLSKRVTWGEKINYIDLHEEQFDGKGNLYKVTDNIWVQIPPWNYWVRQERNILNLAKGHRTIFQSSDWIFDQGLSEKKFTPENCQRSISGEFLSHSLRLIKYRIFHPNLNQGTNFGQKCSKNGLR